MSRQLDNFNKRVRVYHVKILTTLEEYLKAKELTVHPELILECSLGHQFKIKTSSLYNKLNKCKKENLDNICAECDKPKISGEELSVKEKCEKLGLEFINYAQRSVTYKCQCGNVTSTHSRNITRKGRKAQCPKCQNNKFRNDQDDVKECFASQGCELLSNYTSRNSPLEYRCCCGTIAKIRYADFKRGKRCHQKCKAQKFKKCCQNKYGVDNVFQLEEVKEKSKATCKKKYGIEYCMQAPEVFKKAMSTAYHRKKVYTHGNYEWIVQGYEPFCIRDLLDEFKPKEIIAGEGSSVPSCKYIYKDKERVWHPDIYLPTINKIIEIKSTWTYTRSAEQIRAKMEHCKYDCELRIYERDGEIYEVVNRDVSTGAITYYYGDRLVLGEPLQ